MQAEGARLNVQQEICKVQVRALRSNNAFLSSISTSL